MFNFEPENSSNDFLMGMLVGGVIGALGAMLFTTDSGKKMQKEMGHKYKEYSDKIEELVESFNPPKPHKKARKKAK